MLLDAFEVVFPIFSGTQKIDSTDKLGWRFISDKLMGTAFSLGNGIFITAAHVILDSLSHGTIGIGKCIRGKGVLASLVEDYEIIHDYDIAILKCTSIASMKLDWDFTVLKTFEDVFASGYPFGLDIVNNSVDVRGKKGYIVSEKTFFQLSKSKPRAYELSFPIFNGMSGAPLFLKKESKLVVVGICIGNQETSIKIFDSKEIIEENKTTLIVEQFRSFSLGIALTSLSLENITSKLLNLNLKNHVSNF